MQPASRSRGGKRAVMLITVLFFTVLTLMFVGSAIALAPSSLSRSSNIVALAAADRAAKSGLDWARARISQDPRWEARDELNFQQPDLVVREGHGQVEGWLHGAQGWSRFRLRFNYQDGPASPDPASDGMDDPPSRWSDFPYVSCNNLIGASTRTLPRAGSVGTSSSSQPWTDSQLSIPSNTMLISVEGGLGRDVELSGQVPQRFLGPYHKRTVQALLKLGNNQPITAAAMMAAGGLTLSATSPIRLEASSGQTARVRTKQALSVRGGINTEKAELRYGTTQNVNGPYDAQKVSIGQDDTTGFFKIPYDKVRTPAHPATLAAGTYVVTADGQVMFHNMNYADYLAASPRPTGNPVALPEGMRMVGPNTDPSKPKYSIRITKDVQITSAGGVTDFALVPDGGAPQSEAYGGGQPSETASGSATPADVMSYWFNADLSQKPPLNPATVAAWKAFADAFFTGSSSGNWVYYNLPGSASLQLPKNLNPSAEFVYVNTSGFTSMDGTKYYIQSLLQSNPTHPAVAGLLSATHTDQQATASPGSSPTPGQGNSNQVLNPKDLELQLQGGSAGLVLANDGSITLGTQIQGNGSSLVSRHDITLIGTSTEFSSDPGTQLGLNMYAQGKIIIDAFRLDSSGGSFHGVDLKGIIYSWKGLKILASAAPVKLRGSLVGYGGDPSGDPTPGTADISIDAGDLAVTYDPSYVASLLGSGPYTLDILSWHEF